MSKIYFVVSDIHGFYYELISSLSNKGFDITNPDHIFISCGDMFDRGEHPYETLQFVMSIPQERRILIRGNHEDLLEEILNEEREIGVHDIQNGTVDTIENIAHATDTTYIPYDWEKAVKIASSNQLLREYLNSTVDYAEVDETIFVHGWIPVDEKYNILPNWRNATKSQWKNARWLNGMNVAHHGHIIPDKTIVCGHYHCSWGWSHIKQSRKEFPARNRINWEKSFESYCDNGIIAIDSCVAYSGFINCICFEE